jgi:signal transduction histidine kinase
LVKVLQYLLKIYFLISIPYVNAQTLSRYNSFLYSVNEGLLQTSMIDIAVDQNNFCWISFPNGIQKFDGKNFTLVPIQNGLPDDKFVHFFKCKNGDLLISHTKGISKYVISNNKFVQLLIKSTPIKKPDIFIGEDGDFIYLFSENGEITSVHNKKYIVHKITQTELPSLTENPLNFAKFSSTIFNHKIALQINSKLYLWDLESDKLFCKSASIPDISPFYIFSPSEKEVQFYTNSKNTPFCSYNFITEKTTTLPLKFEISKLPNRCNRYKWQTKDIISYANRIYETDLNNNILKTEIVNFQNQSIGRNLSIEQIKEDNFGNLFLQTVTGGIIKVIQNNFPLKYFGTTNNEDNIILSIYPDKKNNRILAGTFGNGLLVFDTLQQLIKHIKTLPGVKQSMAINSIVQDNKDYILFISSENKICRISNDFSKVAFIPITTTLSKNESGLNYFGNTLAQYKQGAIVQSSRHLYKLIFAEKTITEFRFTESHTLSGILANSTIISHANDELIFIDATSFKEIKKIPFKNTGYVRCFAIPLNAAKVQERNILYLGTNNGLFVIDTTGKILKHLTKENGLPDDCIYAMAFDANNFIWCSTNKGIFKLNKDNSILHLTKEDGLQENEFNTNVVAKAADGELFFGGVNGISSFYPTSINSFNEKINLLVTQIKVNNKIAFTDTAVWNIEKIELSHNHNLLSFDFIAMGNANPNQYVYQYQMEGIDKEWIQNNDLQTVRYFLPPGNYVFKIFASRFFDTNAKPLKVIHITIHPPFWKTWWFIVISMLCLATLLGLIINSINKRKYKNKMMEVLQQQKIQSERERISRDLHDSVGAYANAVLYKTELLDNEIEPIERKELMQDLKFASKDIITSLRETVWALKKDQYSSEDCLVRIRNFVQPLAKYYSNINLKIEVVAPDDLNFHYTKALNLIRIIQEAISNSIKHAKAKNIEIKSSMENGKWTLRVIDDGIGFDYGVEKENESGNGLVNMERRAIDSGFQLEIKTGKNLHTCITIIT